VFYAFFWVIPRRLNYSDARELPRRKHKTFRTQQKFEIKNYKLIKERSARLRGDKVQWL